MSLTKYKQKRHFTETPEPKGGKAEGEKLLFVIQKHAASHLHYDFRLEMRGVLKSWAVPKGPSTDPATKRLAMMVEDHPYDYRTFEGIIPKGQYGGGTVMVWDEGTYECTGMEGADKVEQEKALLKALHTGSLKITMHGKKLKGEFALVKTKGMGENGWLLIKHKDKYASVKDITAKDKSVVSNKNLEQIAATTHNIYGKTTIKPGTTDKDTAPKKAVKKKPLKHDLQDGTKKILKSAPASKFTTKLQPMLATLVDKNFDDEDWIYEVKWDGYRALCFFNKGTVELKSRNNKDFNEKFYPIYNTLKKWKINAIIDGEIVVVNGQGLPSFGALQNWRSEADGQIVYYLFDILWLDGKDLTGLSLIERKTILKSIIPELDDVRLSDNFPANGNEFFNTVKQMGMEGIMAKRKDSTYMPGERSKDWLKIKSNKRQEMVIGGYTKNDDTSKPFSSLLLGVYKGKQLIYTGKVGTGFNIKNQTEMLKQFKPLIIDKPPFETTPDVNKPSRFQPHPPHAEAIWLKPKLVCEVSFAEMTADGIMRHPSFEGMREDKKTKEVVLEKAEQTKKAVDKSVKGLSQKIVKATNQKRKPFLNPTDETQVRALNGHELKFTNLSKVFWPADKVTKRDMLNYYYQVAPFILPYLKNRPQSLNRHPNGITGESFYQKDITGKAPQWLDTFLYHSEADARDKHFLVAQDEASLLYMASLGCIEMNPWSSTVKKPDNPDWCIIDLDPDKNSFNQVIEAAQVTKAILDDMKVPSYCKTSGSTGLHIYIPLGAKYSYEQSKEFARVIVKMVHDQLPKFTSLERSTAKRGGKMYLDFLQNRPQATIAAPYSLRPKPGATVSMPLHWDEVKAGLKMKDFTIFNAIDRIKETGDIFKPVLGKGIDLKKVVNALSKSER